MPDPNSYIDGLYNTIKLNVPGFKKSPQEFSDALNNDAGYRQGIYTMLKDNIPTFTKTTSEFNDSVIKKISAKDAMAKYGITNQMPAKESTIVVNPQETLKGTVAKETGIATEKKRVKETPVALENSADLYFKNNGIAPTKIQRQQKINDLKKGLESSDWFGDKSLVLGYNSKGEPRIERNVGGFKGFITGTKEGFRQEGEARAFIGMNPDEQIKAMNKELQSDNEYLPANTSYTMLGGLGHSIGEGAPMMGKAITGAVVGSALAAAAPETAGFSLSGVAPTMAFLFSAPGAANVAYMSELKRRYAEGKSNGLSDYEAYHKASNQALVSEGVSLVTNMFLSRIPATKASGEGLNNALEQYVKSGAKTSGEFAGSTAAGTAVNELTAKAQGLNKDKDVIDILGEATKSGTEAGLMGMALHVVSHPEILVTLPKYLQAQVKGYINKADVGEVHAALDEMADKGIATPQGVDAAKEQLSSFDQAAKKVPSGLDEETSGVITGLVEKKNNLEKQKSQLDPSFHEDINNEIEAINKKIEIAKKSDNPLHAEIDANGETLFTPKSFDQLTKKEVEGIKKTEGYLKHGDVEAVEKGEGENKTFVPKATFINENGKISTDEPIKIEGDKEYKDKDKALKAAEDALAQHYYENKMQGNLKPENKNAKKETKAEVIQQPQDEGTASGNELVASKESIPATTEVNKVEQPTGKTEHIKENDKGDLDKIQSEGGKYEIGVNAPIFEGDKYRVSVAKLGDVNNGKGVEKGYINSDHLYEEFDTREEANNYIDKILNKDKKPEQVDTPSSTEAKKADIEKRRQEELKDTIFKTTNYTDEQKLIKEINAKYDAELAALNTPLSTLVGGEGSDGVGGDKGVNPNGGKWEKVIKNDNDGQGGNIKITRFKTTRINKNGEEVEGQDGTRAGIGGREVSWADFKKEFKLDEEDINDLFGGKEPETVTIHETRENEASGKNAIDATFHFGKEEGTQLSDNKRFNFNYEKPVEQSLKEIPKAETPLTDKNKVDVVGSKPIEDVLKQEGYTIKETKNPFINNEVSYSIRDKNGIEIASDNNKENALSKAESFIEKKKEQGKDHLLPINEFIDKVKKEHSIGNSMSKSIAISVAKMYGLGNEEIKNILKNSDYTTKNKSVPSGGFGNTSKPVYLYNTKDILSGIHDKLNENKTDVVGSEDVDGTQTENPSQKTEPIVEDNTPPTPPVSDIQDSGTGSVGNEKGVLNRLFTSEKISKKVKDIFETKGLKYAPKSQEEARVVAKDIIGEFGYEQSIGMAESGRFDGDVNSMIFAESIDQLSVLEGKATTPEEATQHAAQWADYSIRYDELARDKGRFISAIYDFYKKSPLGTVIKENRNREGIFNDWFKGKEVNYKELFDEIKKTTEGKNAIKEEFETLRKEERASDRATKRKNIEDFFDKAKFKGDALYSTVIPPKLINGAIELMKKAFLAGESIGNAVKVAIDHISKEIKDWDAEKFRSEWESKLSIFEKKSKETIDKTSPEYLLQKQKEYLEKFSKKLSGLNDQQKEQVIQKSIKKLIENGALEFDEFKKIIAQVLGVSELTPEQAARMKELSVKINSLQDVATEARLNNRTEKGLADIDRAVLEAEEAAHQLDNMVYVKAAPLSRAMDVIKLNTLGLTSLIKNISYNVSYQPILFTKSLFKTSMDYSIYGVSQLSNKVFGTKIILPENSTFLAQKGYFKGVGQGLKRSLYQVKSGLQDRDYFSKEVRISQIRPRHAWKDLWAWRKGEKFLTNAQVADKIIQGTAGVNAEVIARLLNVGDKWQKFGAEGYTTELIAKKELGIKDPIEKKFFAKFPKEESYRIYKEKGLSDEEAMAGAEEIEKRIIKTGEKSITQQDNWLSDKLKEFDKYLDKKSEDDAIYNVANGLTKILKGFSMPFVKIPLNVAWNVMNFVNPELAVLQSGFYGYIAVKSRLAGDMVKARENTRIAKDWMAHAATGTAMLAATGYLANIGAIRARNDFEEDKARESRGESNYGRQYTLNVSLMNRLATGGSTEEQDGDVWVDLSWFGIAGNIMNIQAKRVEEKKQDKDAAEKDNYFDDLTSRLTSSAAEGLDNGVFSGTNNLLSAYKTGGGYVDSWMIGMSNLGMNFFEPATYAQFSKATMDEKSVYKAESLWAEIVNNQKQRDIIFRQFAGKPPSDVTIWGEPYKKAGGLEGVAFNMLGFEKTDASKFGMILYDDYKKSKNTGFFPPAVLDKIKVNGADVKLPVSEATDLKRMIGQKRKSMVEPFIMGKAYYAGKTYSQIENESDKVEALKTIYDQAREIAIADFRNKYPKYQETEKTHQQKTQEEKEKKNKEKLLKQVTQ